MSKLKVLELFGGIGACSKALERLGIDYEIADYVEIDKYAVASFNAIHNTNFEPQDICEWDKDIEVDLLMHGSPCQDFSVAGLQASGDKDSGTRSSLMWETIRIVEKIKPKCVIWENVKNLLSQKHRHNFDAYLETMEQLGYENYYKVLNAKDYGIPQNRERIFTISIKKTEFGDGMIMVPYYEFPKPQELKLKLKDMLEDEVDEKYYLKKTNNLVFNESRASWDNSGKGYGSQQDRAYYQDGLCPTLSNCNASGDKSQVVLQDKALCINSLMYNGKNVKLPTIQAAMGNGGGNVPVVVKNQGKEIVKKTEMANTLMARDYKGFGNQEMTGVCKNAKIRKLTPKECWRLMGFDDIDYEKAAKVNSNTQLYKQAGNSIVVNVLEAILTNLLIGD